MRLTDCTGTEQCEEINALGELNFQDETAWNIAVNEYCGKCQAQKDKALTLDDKGLVEELAITLNIVLPTKNMTTAERERYCTNITQSLLPIIAARVEQAKVEERERVIKSLKERMQNSFHLGSKALIEEIIEALKEGK